MGCLLCFSYHSGTWATDWANDGVFGEGWSLFGLEVPGIPVVVEGFLAAVGCADWLSSLILDGIVAGVGAVLGFVPQMLVLFIFLAFLESCGYMARVAFYHGQNFPEIRIVRKVLYSHADWNRLRCSRHHGFPYH